MRLQPVWYGFWVSALILIVAVAGCRNDMYDQPRFEDYEPTTFFEDNNSVRPFVAGTVPRGWERAKDPHFFYGVTSGGELATTFPFEIDRQVLRRGMERYNIFCSPCHGYDGYGNGMIVQRGFDRRPPSFHEEHLRNAPVGHFFDVISNGFGVMYEYGDRITPADRWAIVAYIRTLQRSQNANVEEVPAEQLEQPNRQEQQASPEEEQ